MKMPRITWPTALALSVVVAAVLAAYLAGPALGVPEESHTQLVAGLGIAGAMLLAVMRALLGKDADGDGVPDVLDADEGDS